MGQPSYLTDRGKLHSELANVINESTKIHLGLKHEALNSNKCPFKTFSHNRDNKSCHFDLKLNFCIFKFRTLKIILNITR